MSTLLLVVLFMTFFVQITPIYHTCTTDNECPANAYCGTRKYCVCNVGFIVNCEIPSRNLTNLQLAATIGQNYTYFTIQPQSLYNYLKFKFQISTTQNSSQSIIATVWGQTGFLTNLTEKNQISQSSFVISFNNSYNFETTYFDFGLQTNGQTQQLYLGIKLNSTSNSNSTGNNTPFPLLLSVVQQAAYSQDIFKTVITVLMGIISVSCLSLLCFYIYKKRLAYNLEQRQVQEKQINQTDHFQRYMPIVKAERVNIPLQICSVCLMEITPEDIIRVTICRHLFHIDCIDSWCKKNMSCPLCRHQLDAQTCTRILGQTFNIQQVQSIKSIEQSYRKQVQSTAINMHPIAQTNPLQQQIHYEIETGHNSIRRPML